MEGDEFDIKECYRGEVHKYLMAARTYAVKAEKSADVGNLAESQTMGILSLSNTVLAFVLMAVSESEAG